MPAQIQDYLNPDPSLFNESRSNLSFCVKVGGGGGGTFFLIKIQKGARRIFQPFREKIQLLRCEILRDNFGLLGLEFTYSHLAVPFMDLKYCILY